MSGHISNFWYHKLMVPVVSTTSTTSIAPVAHSFTPTSITALRTQLANLSKRDTSHGIHRGAIAGIVIGTVIGISLIICSVILWLRIRRRSPVPNYGPPLNASTSKRSANGMTSRPISQLSSVGLLTKAPQVTTTRGLTNDTDCHGNKTGTIGSQPKRAHLAIDQRLNPWAMYSSKSNISFQDDRDYSRRLSIINPFPRDI